MNKSILIVILVLCMITPVFANYNTFYQYGNDASRTGKVLGNGKVNLTWSSVVVPGNGSSLTPLIADMDGDGMQDVMITTQTGVGLIEGNDPTRTRDFLAVGTPFSQPVICPTNPSVIYGVWNTSVGFQLIGLNITNHVITKQTNVSSPTVNSGTQLLCENIDDVRPELYYLDEKHDVVQVNISNTGLKGMITNNPTNLTTAGNAYYRSSQFRKGQDDLIVCDQCDPVSTKKVLVYTSGNRTYFFFPKTGVYPNENEYFDFSAYATGDDNQHAYTRLHGSVNFLGENKGVVQSITANAGSNPATVLTLYIASSGGSRTIFEQSHVSTGFGDVTIAIGKYVGLNDSGSIVSPQGDMIYWFDSDSSTDRIEVFYPGNYSVLRQNSVAGACIQTLGKQQIFVSNFVSGFSSDVLMSCAYISPDREQFKVKDISNLSRIISYNVGDEILRPSGATAYPPVPVDINNDGVLDMVVSNGYKTYVGVSSTSASQAGNSVVFALLNSTNGLSSRTKVNGNVGNMLVDGVTDYSAVCDRQGTTVINNQFSTNFMFNKNTSISSGLINASSAGVVTLSTNGLTARRTNASQYMDLYEDLTSELVVPLKVSVVYDQDPEAYQNRSDVYVFLYAPNQELTQYLDLRTEAGNLSIDSYGAADGYLQKTRIATMTQPSRVSFDDYLTPNTNGGFDQTMLVNNVTITTGFGTRGSGRSIQRVELFSDGANSYNQTTVVHSFSLRSGTTLSPPFVEFSNVVINLNPEDGSLSFNTPDIGPIAGQGFKVYPAGIPERADFMNQDFQKYFDGSIIKSNFVSAFSRDSGISTAEIQANMDRYSTKPLQLSAMVGLITKYYGGNGVFWSECTYSQTGSYQQRHFLTGPNALSDYTHYFDVTVFVNESTSTSGTGASNFSFHDPFFNQSSTSASGFDQAPEGDSSAVDEFWVFIGLGNVLLRFAAWIILTLALAIWAAVKTKTETLPSVVIVLMLLTGWVLDAVPLIVFVILAIIATGILAVGGRKAAAGG